MKLFLEIWSPMAILFSAFIVGWAAEAAQTFISRALALSVLAWLQTLPEFGVEWGIAWHQKQDLMIANLTGSLRILVGLGWPLIFFVHYFAHGKKREIRLPPEDFLPVFFLFFSILYFLFIWLKGSLSIFDSLLLIGVYGVYLLTSLRLPVSEVEETENMPAIVAMLARQKISTRVIGVTALFVVGGLLLYFAIDPFLHTLERWSVTAGISTFVFVQWVAPFLSEFPEKVSALNWARRNKASLAVMNMVSSNINQWTVLAAMIPIVFSLSAGMRRELVFDELQSKELALTLAQSFLGGLLLLDLEFSWTDALIIFILWSVQFFVPSTRLEVMFVYVGWAVFEMGRMIREWLFYRRIPRAFGAFQEWRGD